MRRETAMFCSTCGSPISQQSKFCGKCGAKQGTMEQTRNSQPDSIQLLSPKIQNDREHPAGRTLFVTTNDFASTLSELLSEIEGYTSNVVAVPSNSNEELAQHCTAHLKDFESICVVGGFSDIGPFQVPNPAANFYDDDEWCFTDGLFACPERDQEGNDVESAIPLIGISRIPTLNTETVRKLLGSIELKGNVFDQFCFGVTAELWETATARIFRETSLNSKPLYSSPDIDEESVSNMINDISFPNDARLYLFNVHGSGETTEWVGDGERHRFGPTVLSPRAFQDMSHSILISEACYGGAMQYEESSIVEQFFESNGQAFVGCSVVAYGNPGDEDMPLFGADIIALSFLRNLGAGETLGESLRKAKHEALNRAMSVCEDADDPDPEVYGSFVSKTILSFNVFGVPWLRFNMTSAGSTSAFEQDSNSERPLTSNRLNDLRARVNSRMQSRSQRLTERLSPLRSSYRSRLPLKSQLFLMSVDESLAAFESFRDAQKIQNFLGKRQIDISSCRFFKSKKTSSKGYVISARQKSSDRGIPESIALITNAHGELKFVIASKG
jgi:hypothetical protein